MRGQLGGHVAWGRVGGAGDCARALAQWQVGGPFAPCGQGLTCSGARPTRRPSWGRRTGHILLETKGIDFSFGECF